MTEDFLTLNRNKRLLMNGLDLLPRIPHESVSFAHLDFQYRHVLDQLKYGNEGSGRQVKRTQLPQMDDGMIRTFLYDAMFTLKPSGYMGIWLDKFGLCEGVHKEWFSNLVDNRMVLVDMITWDKEAIKQGWRSRNQSEFLLFYQKKPKVARKTWTDRGIPDYWSEKILKPRSQHPHRKPEGLLTRLVKSITKEGEYILDPCFGSGVMLDICQATGRNFIGCDISEDYASESVKLPTN